MVGYFRTMVDTKICNAVTNTLSTMRSYNCGLTSENFNLNKRFEVDPENIKYGLPIVHAKIRLFESLFHLNYKVSSKKWQIRAAEEKKIIKQRKEQIQQVIRNKMGILNLK